MWLFFMWPHFGRNTRLCGWSHLCQCHVLRLSVSKSQWQEHGQWSCSLWENTDVFVSLCDLEAGWHGAQLWFHQRWILFKETFLLICFKRRILFHSDWVGVTFTMCNTWLFVDLWGDHWILLYNIHLMKHVHDVFVVFNFCSPKCSCIWVFPETKLIKMVTEKHLNLWIRVWPQFSCVSQLVFVLQIQSCRLNKHFCK